MRHILIVVDMQKDFVDGALGTKEAAAIVPRVCSRIRSHNGPIFVTYDTHFENYMDTREGKNLPVKHWSRAASAGRFTVRPPRRWRKWKPRPLTSWSSAWT